MKTAGKRIALMSSIVDALEVTVADLRREIEQKDARIAQAAEREAELMVTIQAMRAQSNPSNPEARVG